MARKSAPVKVIYADGTTAIRKASSFAKRTARTRKRRRSAGQPPAWARLDREWAEAEARER